MSTPTADEKRHMNKVAGLNCIVCRMFLDIYDTPASFHHVREGNGLGQNDNMRGIPLCPNHHQHGGPGVAFHHNQALFEAAFCSEERLLKEVEKIL